MSFLVVKIRADEIAAAHKLNVRRVNVTSQALYVALQQIRVIYIKKGLDRNELLAADPDNPAPTRMLVEL